MVNCQMDHQATTGTAIGGKEDLCVFTSFGKHRPWIWNFFLKAPETRPAQKLLLKEVLTFFSFKMLL